MNKKVVPMIHVPDVRATVEWYESIGFNAVATYGNEEDGLSFAIMAFGDGEVMFNEEGETSTKRRREVDLYVYTDNVDELHERLKDRVDVVKGPHNTFQTLQSYVGKYKGAHGPEVEVTVKNGKLFVQPGSQQPMSLWPLDQTTFKPIAFDGATITFNIEDGLTFIQDGHENHLDRIDRIVQD